MAQYDKTLDPNSHAPTPKSPGACCSLEPCNRNFAYSLASQCTPASISFCFFFLIFPNQHQIIRLLIYFAFPKFVLVYVFCWMNNLNMKKKIKLAHDSNEPARAAKRAELSVFLKHRQVNLYLRIWLGWCTRRTQGFILVQTKYPYV